MGLEEKIKKLRKHNALFLRVKRDGVTYMVRTRLKSLKRIDQPKKTEGK